MGAFFWHFVSASFGAHPVPNWDIPLGNFGPPLRLLGTLLRPHLQSFHTFDFSDGPLQPSLGTSYQPRLELIPSSNLAYIRIGNLQVSRHVLVLLFIVMLVCPQPGTRRAQLVTHGLGRHFESPKRLRDKIRTNTVVNVPGQPSKHRYALARLAQLQSTTDADTSESCDHEAYSTDFPWENEAVDDSVMDEDYVPSDTDHSMQDVEPGISETQPIISNRRIIPDLSAERLYSNWKCLIPTLVLPFLNYTSRTLGKPLPPHLPYISLCKQTDCERKVTKIICLLFDRK